jgi:hypothetical protein
MDVREPWVAELADIWHTVRGEDATDPTRHTPVLSTAFDPVDSITVDWAQPMLLDALAEPITTRSYYLNASASERAQVESDVAAFLRDQFRNVETVDLPYRTHCFKTVLS